MRHHAAVLGTFFFVACGPMPGDSEAIDLEAEILSLRAAAETYHAAASAKQSDLVVGLYGSDPLMIPPNAPLVEGTEAVEGYRFGFIVTPGVSLDFEILRIEVSESADMGWTLARGDITIEAEDGTIGRDEVRDFHVWEKRDDGTWAVVVDVWNSGMPAGG